MSTKFDRWLERLRYVEQQMYALRLDQMVWHRVQEIIGANPRLTAGNLFFASMARGYVHRMTVAVRRLVEDKVPGRNSLAGLLQDIQKNASEVTLERFQEPYRESPGLEFGAYEFNRIHGREPHEEPPAHLAARIPKKDRARLIQITARIKQLVDREIAHAGATAGEDAPDDITFAELDAALDVLSDMLKKYMLILSGVGVGSTIPAVQYDWEAVLRIPWITEDALPGEVAWLKENFPVGSIAGVDACPGGWIAVWSVRGKTPQSAVFPSFGDLIDGLPGDCIVGIDVPIGLPDQGQRGADVEARRRLGWPRRASVFSSPIRPVLAAKDYADACAIREGVEGKRMSRQAWGIVPKVREVDAVLRGDPGLIERVFEVHPEVSFAAWNGGVAMADSKKSKAGRAARRGLVGGLWPGVFPRLRGSHLVRDVAHDDLLDAFAALWTASRVALGAAEAIPPQPVTDEFGLPMRIVC